MKSLISEIWSYYRQTASGTEYLYQQLDDEEFHIRILDLLPSRDRCAPLHCSLRETRLAQSGDEPGSYEALSYVWGSSKVLRLMFVHGHVFRITANLDTALRHLRHETQVRSLWIDAICINQKDNKEKSSQVNQMRHVYAKASRVLVWLGPGDEIGRAHV